MKLNEIQIGMFLRRIPLEGHFEILGFKWIGSDAIELTLKDQDGNLVNELLYRENESNYEVITQKAKSWSFSSDADEFKLVSEAYRINLAHLFDPYLAVYTSSIEPLPHQISAVYEVMLNKLPLRYVLADDPGAGKTIMTGLLIKELVIRGDVKRCLIVCPGNLAEQWQDEMFQKFSLNFEIVTTIGSDHPRTFFSTDASFSIARLDKLSRDMIMQEKLKSSEWDLIVVDEAHKMSATIWGGEVKYTKRYLLGKLLSEISRHFLLLTATPHNGKEDDFNLFMSLIDPDRFEQKGKHRGKKIDVSDVMRRLQKEDLLKFDGKPLFPERIAYTVNYSLSMPEKKLYDLVTDYVREEFNRADRLNSDRKTTVGFALTVLQRRLASSPEAIFRSIQRRKERLELRLQEYLKKQIPTIDHATAVFSDDIDDYDESPSGEIEELEEKVVDQATAALTVEELTAEIDTLKELEIQAGSLRASGIDRKWNELSSILQDDKHLFGSNGRREKIIIFTEHKDTLYYLEDKVSSLFGNHDAIAIIHGGIARDKRRTIEASFQNDPNVSVLIATDAAGEGINLQKAHLMVNYDLPWNPNRLEQRFGRIHRIGQTEVCHLWNMVSSQTREGMVFVRLLSKIEEEKSALRGKVFDILGKMTFNDRPLRDLIIEAIRYGSLPEVKERMNRVVDQCFDHDHLRTLLEEQFLSENTMNVGKVLKIREDMQRLETRKLQPYFIEGFFKEAFSKLGGVIRKREEGRYELLSVPSSLASRSSSCCFGNPVVQKYERVCFEKKWMKVPAIPEALLLSPGQALFQTVINETLDRYKSLIKSGTILINEKNTSSKPKILFYLETTMQDGVILPNGKRRIISKKLNFLETDNSEIPTDSGFAPYLDYRKPSDVERNAIIKSAEIQKFLMNDFEKSAYNYAISYLVPTQIAVLKSQRLSLIDKIEKAVKERLTSAIQYWDYRAAELKEKEASGKINAKLNSSLAQKRADDLSSRLEKRLNDLSLEKHITAIPPSILGGAIIVPQEFVATLVPQKNDPQVERFGENRKEIELIAMAKVMELELEMGNIPIDVSAANCGYDVESKIRTSGKDVEPIRMIEVKGRAWGSTTVTVTKNEIITALNKPEAYILAIVLVDGEQCKIYYIKTPFLRAPDFSATSVNYNISDLIKSSGLLLERQI